MLCSLWRIALWKSARNSFFVGDVRVKLFFVTDRAISKDARCIMSESVNLLMLEFLSWVSSLR